VHRSTWRLDMEMVVVVAVRIRREDAIEIMIQLERTVELAPGGSFRRAILGAASHDSTFVVMDRRGISKGTVDGWNVHGLSKGVLAEPMGPSQVCVSPGR